VWGARQAQQRDPELGNDEERHAPHRAVKDRNDKERQGGALKIYAPDGSIGKPSLAGAATPSVIAGLRIGVLDNGKPNARIMMVRMAEQLAARTGASLSMVTGKGPAHNAATACSDEVLDRLEKEVDLVITGSAD
jgi:hypothetical protein